MPGTEYASSVFVNCPFDDAYEPIRNAIVFAIFDCGFLPRCALEENDGGDVRMEKIQRIIEECKFGVHDISRTGLEDHNDLPRFNMPLELGMFLGARKYGSAEQKLKRCLVLDREPFRYREFISDIAGQDIRCHRDEPANAIREIRDWLNQSTDRRTIPGGTLITSRYRQFTDDLPEICLNVNLEDDEVTYNDYCNFVSDWLKSTDT